MSENKWSGNSSDSWPGGNIGDGGPDTNQWQPISQPSQQPHSSGDQPYHSGNNEQAWSALENSNGGYSPQYNQQGQSLSQVSYGQQSQQYGQSGYGNQQPAAPTPGAPMQGVQQTPGAQPAPTKSNAPMIAIISVLALVIVGLAGFLGYSMMSGDDAGAANTTADGGSNAGADNPNPMPGATNGSAGNSGSAPTAESNTKARAENWTAPNSWIRCGGSGEPGDFNLYFAGTSTTTCGFVSNVRDAFVDQYLTTERTNATVRAYSPRTGLNYTMTCTDDGDVVTCTGGRNAVVHIV